jgi:sulfate transport system ATP-binding protein
MSIIVKSVSKRFGDFVALDDVSLNVANGSLLALLGPSGSGKTTLLRIIAGLEVADEGTVLYQEEDITHHSARERMVGFVFQHYALFRHMTVADNIGYGLRVRGVSKRERRERVEELLRLIRLDGFGSRYPSQLSGGQRQRVALARALAAKPRVLLLDEPFGALDAKVRQELRLWLRKLHEEIHVTSIFVTHDQEEAFAVADRVVVMNQGKIEQIGSPDEVFHHPQTEFVMRFLGETNMFPARVDVDTVQFGPIELPFPQQRQQVVGDARVFIRPHDLTIDTKTNGLPSLTAEVIRVQSAGPVVRIELRTDQEQVLSAELSQERFSSMNLSAGSTVYVRPRHIRVFSG